MKVFAGVHIVCFFSSYLVALGLELLRPWWRAPAQWLLSAAFTLAGLLAHTIYMVRLAHHELTAGSGLPFSSWFDWCLLAAWVVAAIYSVLLLRRPENAFGVFILPLLLLLIAGAVVMRGAPAFGRTTTFRLWRSVHGLSLLLGTVAVVVGFAAGAMYLYQAWRLKHLVSPRRGLRLPSLEWLQGLNRWALATSTTLLGIGLLSGVMLNLLQRGHAVVAWSDPAVWSSALLFGWLLAASIFEWLYKPARQGRKVAYLTIASFVFLVLALGLVLAVGHATAAPEGAAGWLPGAGPGMGGTGAVEVVQP